MQHGLLPYVIYKRLRLVDESHRQPVGLESVISRVLWHNILVEELVEGAPCLPPQ